MTEPLVVVSVDGNKCRLQAPDGTQIANAHAEQCILVPPDAVPTSHRPDIENLEEGEGPSLGECLDVPFNRVRAPEDKNRGMLDKVTVGVLSSIVPTKRRRRAELA